MKIFITVDTDNNFISASDEDEEMLCEFDDFDFNGLTIQDIIEDFLNP